MISIEIPITFNILVVSRVLDLEMSQLRVQHVMESGRPWMSPDPLWYNGGRDDCHRTITMQG